MDCDTIFDRTDGSATWTVVHYRHLSEAVALIQRSEQVIPSAPGLSTAALPISRTNIESPLSRSRKKKSLAGPDANLDKAEQELEHFGPNSAKDGHLLQELDPRFMHSVLHDCTYGAKSSTLTRRHVGCGSVSVDTAMSG